MHGLTIVYLPTLTHYAWVSRLVIRDIYLTHQGQFLTRDSQIWTSCSKKSSFHFRFVMYYFFTPYNNCKSFQMSTIRMNGKCSKVVGISLNIFGNVWKSSESRQKSLEVARTFSEILVMTRQKSHAFDSEKVGRYTIVWGNGCGEQGFPFGREIAGSWLSEDFCLGLYCSPNHRIWQWPLTGFHATFNLY